MIAGRRPVVYFPGVAWDDVTGTDRRLAVAMARSHPVLWVDPPVPLHRWVGAHGPAALFRPVRTVQRSARLVVVSTVGPPWPNRRLTWRLSAWCAAHAARAAAPEGPLGSVVSNPQPRHLGGGRRVYYATDDFPAGADLMGISEHLLRRWEERQLSDADALFAISPVLARRWSAMGYPTARTLPNGCDPELFDRVQGGDPAPEVRLDGPVAGVVGQLGARLDLDMLEAVADVMALLLVGPLDPAPSPARYADLLARPHVQWVGPQPHERIPEFLSSMDVGLTPYASSTFNDASVPLKTLEYIAAGLPVVSSALPALDLLPHGLVVAADTPEAFAAAAARAAAGSDRFTDDARTFAIENSWAVRARTLLDALEEG